MNLKSWKTLKTELGLEFPRISTWISMMTMLGFVVAYDAAVASSKDAIIDPNDAIIDFNFDSDSALGDCGLLPALGSFPLSEGAVITSCQSSYDVLGIDPDNDPKFSVLLEIYDESPVALGDKTLAIFEFRELKGLGIANSVGHLQPDTYLYEINEGEALKISVDKMNWGDLNFIENDRFAQPLITGLDFGFLFGPGSGDFLLEKVLVEAFADETFLGQGTLSVNSDETTASWEFVCDSGIQNNCNIDGAEVINDPDVASIIPNGGFGPGRYNVRYPFGKRSVNSFNETITHLIIKPQDSAEGTVHDFGLVGVTVDANDVPEPSSFLALISVGAIAGGIKLKKKAD